jgi:DNA repair protein RadA/Sms
VARARAEYRCGECGAELAKWFGRCPECQSWGSIAEAGGPSRAGLAGPITAGPVSSPAVRIAEIDVVGAASTSSGVPELDRVLGGGFVPGAVILLAGEPGVGKSTLLLEVAARSADQGPVLVVSGEESTTQVRLRAERTGALHDQLWLAAENDLAAVLGHIDNVKPSLLILDSVQTISSTAVEGGAGGVAQVREVAAALTRVAKERGLTTILVGHVTKEGSLAGPRTLEHLVDVVLQFEGERHSSLRLVRAIKNRYGPADEVGCFEMSEDGIHGVSDPSGLFVTHRTEPVAGTCLTVSVEGRRPFVAEVQALVGEPAQGENADKYARRGVHGLDQSRFAMLMAVLNKFGVKTIGREVYAATVGGMRVVEPAGDLAICLAIASVVKNRPAAGNCVAIGEVGLTGDVRTVPALSRRLTEAARMGVTHALVPRDTVTAPPGMRVDKVETLQDALRLLGL